MSERYHAHENNNEQQFNSLEVKQHNERLKELHERSAEKAAKNTSQEKERARHEIEEAASTNTEKVSRHTEAAPPSAPVTKADKTHSFNTVMHHARQNMSKPERVFSKVIHIPLVEKTSEALSKTVARPSGILGATTAAFLGLLSLYGVAKFAGFELSGSEMPLLLASGFIIGLFVEWAFKSVRAILSSKRH